MLSEFKEPWRIITWQDEFHNIIEVEGTGCSIDIIPCPSAREVPAKESVDKIRAIAKMPDLIDIARLLSEGKVEDAKVKASEVMRILDDDSMPDIPEPERRKTKHAKENVQLTFDFVEEDPIFKKMRESPFEDPTNDKWYYERLRLMEEKWKKWKPTW